ncbi:hypothetical protein BC629DRAFT_1656506 [Irpex lacteus]|nr:hypothetical protein BC629DRAFT_1656506 [Irpex lacteus]
MALIHALCLSLLLLVVPPSLVIANDNPDALRVLHRIYHPSRPSEPFTDRGALILTRSGPAAATPHTFTAAAFQSILEELATKGLSASKASQEVLYQLALEHPGDTHHSQWHVSSVKACHLAQSTYEDVTVHLSANTSLPPFALDYFVGPIPHDGSCPRIPKRTSPRADTHASSDEARPETPPPTLKTPPPVNAEGNVVQPPPEKSFLQKYWIYIALGMAALGASFTYRIYLDFGSWIVA